MKKLNNNKKLEKRIKNSLEALKFLFSTYSENIVEHAKNIQPMIKKLRKPKDCKSGLQKPIKSQKLNALIVVY